MPTGLGVPLLVPSFQRLLHACVGDCLKASVPILVIAAAVGVWRDSCSSYSASLEFRFRETFAMRRRERLGAVAMFIDGVEIAEHCVVVALGVDADGRKHPLGLVGRHDRKQNGLQRAARQPDRARAARPRAINAGDGRAGSAARDSRPRPELPLAQLHLAIASAMAALSAGMRSHTDATSPQRV